MSSRGSAAPTCGASSSCSPMPELAGLLLDHRHGRLPRLPRHRLRGRRLGAQHAGGGVGGARRPALCSCTLRASATTRRCWRSRTPSTWSSCWLGAQRQIWLKGITVYERSLAEAPLLAALGAEPPAPPPRAGANAPSPPPEPPPPPPTSAAAAAPTFCPTAMLADQEIRSTIQPRAAASRASSVLRTRGRGTHTATLLVGDFLYALAQRVLLHGDPRLFGHHGDAGHPAKPRDGPIRCPWFRIKRHRAAPSRWCTRLFVPPQRTSG